MTGVQRLSIALFAASLLLALGMFLIKATEAKQDQVLFWSVEPGKAAEITNKVNDLGISVQYRSGMITVEPGADMDQIKMNLAQEGLLPEDLSYDFEKLVEQSTWTLTKDERERNYMIALANELSAGIQKGMESIESATVMISQEEDTPLLKRHVKRKASVQITKRGRSALKKSEVEAISRLVASAVRGLLAEDVAISDSQGRSYKYNDELDASDKFQMQLELEQKEKRKIEDHLSAFIPKVVATVAVSLNLTQRSREMVDYQHPDLQKGPMAVLERNEQEKETSSSKEGSQGVVGAGTNTSAEIKEGDGGNQMNMNKSRKLENFKNSLIQEKITYDFAERVIDTVAVTVVDKRYNELFDSSIEQTDKNMEYMDHDWLDPTKNPVSLQEMVANIVGISADKVKISQYPMPLHLAPQPLGMFAKTMNGINWVLVLMAALALGAALMVMRMIKKAQPEEEILEMPEFEEEENNDLPPLEEPQKDPKIKQIEDRIREIVDEDPGKAASLITSWLNKD